MNCNIKDILFIRVSEYRAKTIMEASIYNNDFRLSIEEFNSLLSTNMFEKIPTVNSDFDTYYLNKSVILNEYLITNKCTEAGSYKGNFVKGFYYADTHFMFIYDDVFTWVWPIKKDIDIVISYTESNLKIISEI